MMKILALLVSLLTATLCLADNGVSFYGSGHGVAGGGAPTPFLSDSMTEAGADVNIASHSPETGGSYSGDTANLSVIGASAGYASETGDTVHAVINSATPSDNTYTITAECRTDNGAATDWCGVAGRFSGSVGGANREGYTAFIQGSGAVSGYVYNSDTPTLIMSGTITGFSTATTYTVNLIFSGQAYTDITMTVYDGVTEKVNVTNSTAHTVVTQTGNAGTYLRNHYVNLYSLSAVDN